MVLTFTTYIILVRGCYFFQTILLYPLFSSLIGSAGRITDTNASISNYSTIVLPRWYLNITTVTVL